MRVAWMRFVPRRRMPDGIRCRWSARCSSSPSRGRNRQEIDEALESSAMKTFALNAPAELWERHGVSHPVGSGYQDIIPQVFDEESVLSYTSDVPLSLLKDACLQGTPDEIVDQIADWRDHGLSYPVLLNLSTLQPSFRRGLAAGNPFAKALRGIRKL
jgi:phthiodiolone/phenolphthiodiolone dimycocerosates ketoreductase